MKSEKMLEIAITWLPWLGGLIFAIAIAAWYGSGNKSYAIWIAYFGIVVASAGFALNIQKVVWDSSNSSAEPSIKQSRAYVFIDTIRTANIDDDLMNMGPDKIASVLVVVKNTGQTPAFKFWQHAAVRLAEFPPPAGLFKLPPMRPNTIDNLPAGGFAQVTVGLGRPLSDSEKTLLGMGRIAVYLFGEIRYEDAFGFKRCTRYRYRVGGDVGFNGTAMAPMSEGNEADINCGE